VRLVAIYACIAVLSGCAASPGNRQPLAKQDHYVKLKSSAPGMAGGETSVYVREIPAAASSPIAKADRAVLFVHGGSYPGSTVFDLPHTDHSWMRYLAAAGYDTFAIEFTGYGRSTRPPPMDDPCNLSEAQQKQLPPGVIAAPCPPTGSKPITTLESEWEEMDAVIEYIRKLRGVDKVAVVGWSRAGPRTSGYVLRHPEKITRVFILAPDYNRKWPSDTPRKTAPMGVSARPGPGGASRDCEGQIDPAVREIAWNDSLAPDRLGSQWGLRRTLPPLWYGINEELAKGVRVPFAMAVGIFDTLVPPATVRAFYDDIGSQEKVLVELACSSHAAMWEKNRGLLFKASLEWIRDGKIGGVSRGELKLGF
jgi:pimeloyl-ACP methyl ester carboxylesterase